MDWIMAPSESGLTFRYSVRHQTTPIFRGVRVQKSCENACREIQGVWHPLIPYALDGDQRDASLYS